MPRAKDGAVCPFPVPCPTRGTATREGGRETESPHVLTRRAPGRDSRRGPGCPHPWLCTCPAGSLGHLERHMLCRGPHPSAPRGFPAAEGPHSDLSAGYAPSLCTQTLCSPLSCFRVPEQEPRAYPHALRASGHWGPRSGQDRAQSGGSLALDCAVGFQTYHPGDVNQIWCPWVSSTQSAPSFPLTCPSYCPQSRSGLGVPMSTHSANSLAASAVEASRKSGFLVNPRGCIHFTPSKPHASCGIHHLQRVATDGVRWGHPGRRPTEANSEHSGDLSDTY